MYWLWHGRREYPLTLLTHTLPLRTDQVINPNATESIVTQQALAKAANYMLEPGQPFPAEASSSIVQLASTATITASATSSPTSATSSAAAASSDGKLSGGATAGIAVGAAAGALIIAALCFLLWRNRSLAQDLKRDQGGQTSDGSAPAMSDGMSRASIPPSYHQHPQDYKPNERDTIISTAMPSPDLPYTSYHPQFGHLSNQSLGPR